MHPHTIGTIATAMRQDWEGKCEVVDQGFYYYYLFIFIIDERLLLD